MWVPTDINRGCRIYFSFLLFLKFLYKVRQTCFLDHIPAIVQKKILLILDYFISNPQLAEQFSINSCVFGGVLINHIFWRGFLFKIRSMWYLFMYGYVQFAVCIFSYFIYNLSFFFTWKTDCQMAAVFFFHLTQRVQNFITFSLWSKQSSLPHLSSKCVNLF